MSVGNTTTDESDPRIPRRARSLVGDYASHVLDRANGRLRLFKKAADFAAFEQVLTEVRARVPLRVLRSDQ